MRLVQPAALLRAGRISDVDIDLIAEDIERMGKTEKRERVSRLNNLLLHSLKWQFQPSRREFSSRNSIRIQRCEVAVRMADNPSLQVLLGAAID